MMLPIKSTIYSIYLIVLIALGALLMQGVRQNQLYQEHEAIISQTESLIFQFSIIREQVSESLIDPHQSNLSGISTEMEKLNSNLTTILSNNSIGDEYKLTFLNSIDLPGIILLLKKIEGGNSDTENFRNLNQEMRTLGERLILFDRVLVNNAKQKLIGFQNIIIGSSCLIVFLLVIVLALFHRRMIIPLLDLIQKSSLAVSSPIDTIEIASPSREISRVTASIADLLEQRRILRDHQQTYQNAAASVIDSFNGIWAKISRDGTIQNINGHIAEKYGFNREDLIGRNWLELFIIPQSVSESPEDQTVLDILLLAGKTIDVTLYTNNEISKPRLRCRFIVNPAEHQPSSIYCLGFDITAEVERIDTLEHDLLEEKNKKVEMVRVSHLAILGEMSTGVAHEIGNMSNGIINYAQVLADGACDPDFELERDKMFHKIIIEGEKIAGLAKNLLAYGQDDAKTKEIAKVDDILQNALALMSHYFRIDGTTVQTDLDAIPLCKANGRQMQQVFLNVLNNARRALNERFRQKNKQKILEIKAETIGKDGQKMLRMTFTDHGVGIAPDDLPRVFEPSFSTKPSSEGVGMGLTVSRELMHMHHGYIAVDSKVDDHTTVTIELPIS